MATYQYHQANVQKEKLGVKKKKDYKNYLKSDYNFTQ